MSGNGSACFVCGAVLVLGKIGRVEAWRDDCLFTDELICDKCDGRIRTEGKIEVTRGDEVFILRPVRRGDSAG